MDFKILTIITFISTLGFTSGHVFASTDGIYVCTALRNSVAQCGDKYAPQIGVKEGCHAYRFDDTFKFTKKGDDIEFDDNFLVGNQGLKVVEDSTQFGYFYASSYSSPSNTNMKYFISQGKLIYTNYDNYTVTASISSCLKY